MFTTCRTSQLFVDEITRSAREVGVDLRLVNFDDPSPLDPWKPQSSTMRLLELAFRWAPPPTDSPTRLASDGDHRPQVSEWTRSFLRARRLDRLRNAVSVLTDDDTVHAIVWVPPYPGGPTARADIAALIPADRDVDGLHPGRSGDAVSSPALFSASPTATLTEAAADLYATDDMRHRARTQLLFDTVMAACRRNPSIPADDATS